MLFSNSFRFCLVFSFWLMLCCLRLMVSVDVRSSSFSFPFPVVFLSVLVTICFPHFRFAVFCDSPFFIFLRREVFMLRLSRRAASPLPLLHFTSYFNPLAILYQPKNKAAIKGQKGDMSNNKPTKAKCQQRTLVPSLTKLPFPPFFLHRYVLFLWSRYHSIMRHNSTTRIQERRNWTKRKGRSKSRK